MHPKTFLHWLCALALFGVLAGPFFQASPAQAAPAAAVTDFSENFDHKDAPTMPTGWSYIASSGETWRTINTDHQSLPNAAFAPGQTMASTQDMTSPYFTAPYNAVLSFYHKYGFDKNTNFYDGGVLEIQIGPIGTGEWQDILDAGGSFTSGGYNATIYSGSGNPLAGRAAWGGSSSGWQQTVVILPEVAGGQRVQLRWRAGSDNNNVAGAGWTVDTISVSGSAPTVTTLIPSHNPIIYGMTLTLNAQVTTAGGNNVTQGNVSFLLNGASISLACSNVPVNTSGMASCAVSNLSVGDQSFIANYDTDIMDNYRPSSGALTVHVASGGIVENFDSVTLPGLPTGWSMAGSSNGAWATTNTTSQTTPNAARAPDPDIDYTTADIRLESPVFVAPADAVLTFYHAYDFFWSNSKYYDGGVLEIKIGAGAWRDILDAGGSFTSGGYITWINQYFNNPLAGRRGWISGPHDWEKVVVNLPASASGQNVQLRWRYGKSEHAYSNSSLGWNVDTVSITGRAATTITLVGSDPNPSTYGDHVSLVARVDWANGRANQGTVDFEDNGAPIAGCAGIQVTANGLAGCPMPLLTAGSHAFSAHYQGAADFQPSSTTTSLSHTVNKRMLDVQPGGANKVYDGTTAATVIFSDNRLPGDDLTILYSASFASKTVGRNKTVSISGMTLTGADAGNYQLASTTATIPANITPRPLTISASGGSKVYDGSAVATVTLTDNRVSGDALTAAYTSASFVDKNVGTGKPVTVSGITVTGADVINYTDINSDTTLSADITARTLTVSAIGINKTYDGTTAATVMLSDNRVAGDVLTTAYTSAAFANKNTSAGKTVTVSGITVSGTDAANYLYNTSAATSAKITARILTVTATVSNKTYDGTSGATAYLSDDRMTGDALTTSFSYAAFTDKNAGTNKTVTIYDLAISGPDAGNYQLSSTTATMTASIAKSALNVSASGGSKTYNGTATTTVTLSFSPMLGDVLSAAYTSAAFPDKNVGANKLVTVSGITISGQDAANYTPNTSITLFANITPRALTVSATAPEKTYDGTSATIVTLSDNRVLGDILTTAYTSAAFANKNAGTGKTVTVSGITASGTDAGNYTVNTSATTTANITPRTLTLTATGVNKSYDGTTTATVTFTDNHLAGDSLVVAGTASFADKNVGASKPITVNAIHLTGPDAGNYTPNSTTSTTANITPRLVTVNATGTNKIYDGATNATVTYADDRTTGDSITVSGTASFENKNVGVAKLITVNSIQVTGPDAGNYTWNVTTSTTANITARPLSVTATGVNKTYDGTATAMVTFADNHLAGDSLVVGGTMWFADKNVGASKPITVSSIQLTGPDAGNYTPNSTTATTANITPRTLVIQAASFTKIYDGTRNGFTMLTDNRVAGDVLSAAYSGALVADKNVGMNKPVTVSGITLSGKDAGNYQLAATTVNTHADIIAREITGQITAADKAYDGRPDAVITGRALSGVIEGDDARLTGGSASFADKNAGVGKAVTGTGFSLSGVDAGNYHLSPAVTTTASITPVPLSIQANTVTKVYGEPLPTFTVTCTGFVNGESLSDLAGSLAFDLAATEASPVGDYEFTPTGLTSSNYIINFGKAMLHVTAADTTTLLTASETAPALGAAVRLTAAVSTNAPSAIMPVGTVTFLDGSTVLCADVALDHSGQVACDMTASLPFGPHTLSAQYAGNSNLHGSRADLVQQVIDVIKTDPLITWSNPGDITYGELLSDAQLNATASVPGDFVYSPAAGVKLDAGLDQELSVTFVPRDPVHYNTVNKTVQINVLHAMPIITWANPADIPYGTALSEIQLNASASVDGIFLYDPSAGTVLDPGMHTLHVDFIPSSNNYAHAEQEVSIMVTSSNHAPVLATIGDKTVVKGTLLTFTASATDADGDPLTYTLDSGAPEGAVIEPSSGMFAWTPGTEGTFTITIRVSDGKSPAGEDSETILITVEAETQSFIFLPLVQR